MEAVARRKNLKVSPKRLRLIADAVRGKNVGEAIDTLRYSKKTIAPHVIKLIQSAVNNASQDRSVNEDLLFVKEIFVDQGTVLKRGLPRARGSYNRILKRWSHMTVKVAERQA